MWIQVICLRSAGLGDSRLELAVVEGAIDSTVCHRAVDRITSECTQKIFKTLQKHERLSSGDVKWGLNGGSPPGHPGGPGRGSCRRGRRSACGQAASPLGTAPT